MFDSCRVFNDEILSEQPAVTPWNVLVVDDDVDVHAVTRFCLSRAVIANRTLNLIDAHSGRAAIELLKCSANIDLILLDVVMETQDAGLEVARWLHEDAQRATIPKILLRTGQAGIQKRAEMTENKYIDAVLDKSSTTYSSLIEAVTLALSPTNSNAIRKLNTSALSGD